MKKIKKLLILTLTLVMIMSNSIMVFAADENADIDATKAILIEYFKMIDKVNVTTDESKTTEGTWVSVTIDGETVYINEAGVQQALNQAKNDETKENVSTQIANLETGLGELTPDMGWAARTLAPVMPVLRYVLGLMVTVISAGMTILCAADVAYIIFPVFRGKCEDMKQSGNSMAISKGRSEKSGSTKLKFISDEAEYAINAAETSTSGKNPLIIYFGKRCVSYIVLAIVIFILLTGNITILIDIAIKAVSGILDLIMSMGA